MTQPSEKRSLRMHPQLLWDVITKQAGTLQKAVIEGVQNSVDAGGTRCDVTLTRDSFAIADDGKGFVSMREIEDFFETFGYPHKKGDATYGRFRMGRGQMFAFGANTWRSNAFRMDVDLQPQEETVADEGLGYHLSTLPEPVKGCSIEARLYRRLLPSEVDVIEREIAKYAAWAPIPVTVNGKLVSKDPAKAKWDAVTEDAYIRYRENGPLSVYNLGVFVQDVGSHTYGTGGLVVSRKRLDVNFARNAIVDTCEVWRGIRAQVRKDAGQSIKRKPRINESERVSLLMGFLSGETGTADMRDKPVFELANGNRISLDTLGDRLGHLRRVGVTPVKDRIGSRALESKLALVFSRGTLDIAECETALELLGKVHRALARPGTPRDIWPGTYDPSRKEEITPAQMREVIPDDMTEIPKSKLSPAERAALEMITSGMDKVGEVFTAVAYQKRHPGSDWNNENIAKLGITGSILERLSERVKANAGRRDIRVGVSSVAQAWTDGSDTIWFERDMLRLVSQQQKGMVRLAMVGVHEWLHDAPDTGTHLHDAEFYELFHDLCINTPVVGRAVESMIERAVRIHRNEERKPTGLFRKTEDRVAILAENALAFPEPAPGALLDEAPVEEAPAPRM